MDSHFKILVVDDDPLVRAILIELLSGEGYSVITAENGLEGVLKAHNVDLIILDMMMPVFDGLGARKALKEDPRTETIPVLFLTGYDDEEVRRSCAEFSDGVFQKPINCQALLAKVNEFAEQRAALV